MVGELFFRFPAKDWTVTNLQIDSMTRAQDALNASKLPQYVVDGDVQAVNSKQATVRYLTDMKAPNVLKTST